MNVVISMRMLAKHRPNIMTKLRMRGRMVRRHEYMDFDVECSALLEARNNGDYERL